MSTAERPWSWRFSAALVALAVVLMLAALIASDYVRLLGDACGGGWPLSIARNDQMATAEAVVLLALLVIVGVGISIYRRDIRVLGGTLVAVAMLAIGHVVAVDAALTRCTPPEPDLGRMTLDLRGPAWERRLEGLASCAPPRSTGPLQRVTNNRYGVSAAEWVVDGWEVGVSIVVHGAVGDNPAVVELEQTSANPHQAWYEISEGSTYTTEVNSAETSGTIAYRRLVLRTDLDFHPFDPERETDPSGLPDTLDLDVTWTCDRR